MLEGDLREFDDSVSMLRSPDDPALIGPRAGQAAIDVTALWRPTVLRSSW
jgi:hypothetical protein